VASKILHHVPGLNNLHLVGSLLTVMHAPLQGDLSAPHHDQHGTEANQHQSHEHEDGDLNEAHGEERSLNDRALDVARHRLSK
jgi:hypothetical protein